MQNQMISIKIHGKHVAATTMFKTLEEAIECYKNQPNATKINPMHISADFVHGRI